MVTPLILCSRRSSHKWSSAWSCGDKKKRGLILLLTINAQRVIGKSVAYFPL